MRVLFKLILFWTVALFWGVSVSVASEKPKIPVIIDTDMASEDWLAMIYLFQHPEVDLKAITVAGTGEAHCNPGVENAIKLLNAAKHPPVPVTCGREHPGQFGHDFPDEWRASQDAFLPVKLYGPLEEPAALPAKELLKQHILASKEKVVLVVLGPLTNVADAIEAYPQIINNLKMIYVMGGAVFHEGNIHTVTDIPNKVSEWNLFVDPKAAYDVVESGAPITLVPLDATQYVPITAEIIKVVGQTKKTPAAALFLDILETFQDDITSQQWHFWDTLTATLAIDESHAKIETYPIKVQIIPLAVAGQTVVCEEGKPVRIATFADQAQFQEKLLKSLNNSEKAS